MLGLILYTEFVSRRELRAGNTSGGIPHSLLDKLAERATITGTRPSQKAGIIGAFMLVLFWPRSDSFNSGCNGADGRDCTRPG